MKAKKISFKKLVLKSAEKGIVKAIELAIMAIVMGATLRTMIVMVPAVMVASMVGKVAKIKILENFE